MEIIGFEVEKNQGSYIQNWFLKSDDIGQFMTKFDTVQYGVFRLRRRHFLVKRADDGGAPKNEWNEEFEDIITDTIILLLTGSKNQFEILKSQNSEFILFF